NLEELVGLHVDWQFENNKAQVVQLHGTLEKLQCKVCTNIYEFTLQHCEIFKQGLEINQIAVQDQHKADCLIIIGTSLRIPGVKTLIKDFARAVHDQWNSLIDFQIEGACDEWVELVNIELSNVKKIELQDHQKIN
ncbi:2020_t:CDS:2, partial [Racocetra fulgida]